MKVTKAAPTAPTVEQWQNGNLKVTPDTTNGGDRIEIPLTEGGPVVVKKGDNGTWTVEGNHPDVKVTGGSIEVPADKVGDSVTVTAKVGEGDLENSTNSAAYSKQAHTVRKTDIIKKPTDTLSGEDLHTNTGVVGVTVGTEEKDYASSNIHSVTSKEQLPSLTAGSTQDIPVTITYTDGSQEDANVTLKVSPEAPTTSTPTFTVGTQNPLTGNVEVTVDGVPEGTKVKLPGIVSEKVVTGGKVELTNNELPENPTTGKGIAQEEGKLPKEGTSDITIPGKLTSAKGEPAREFEVTIPLPIVVPDPEHLTPKEIEKLVDKVKGSNPNTIVTADDKGNVTVTDKATGESVLIPAKDLTVKDFEPVKPTEKVPVKDKSHLTPEEKKQVADKVKDKNPGKEVTVGDDGTATVTDPTTGISHTIPGTDLVNQDFELVKPTEKVPVKDKSHLTPEEKKQVADKVKDKNPGKEVTVGDDGTATVTDPTTGISHTIPGTDLVNQDFEPVIPADKIPVKDPDNLTQEEQDKVKESVEKANPGKKVTVDKTGKVTITDPNTNISHEIPGEKLITLDPPVFELPEYTAPIGTTGVDENGNLIEPPVKHQTKLIITKWVDEEGHDLKPADAKAPNVLGEANEAFEHGEIEGYVFVRTETKDDVVIHIFRKVSPARSTDDGQQRPATPSDDTNRRPDTVISAEEPATQSQAVLPNTGTQEDRATGSLGVLSLLGAFGLLFAKKKKDDEEEA